jgi:hypothetical protein
MPRTAREPHQVLTDADHGVLREVTEVDLELCDPGTMIYTRVQPKSGNSFPLEIVVTTIIPGHPIGKKLYQGASITGLFPWTHHPKTTELTRHLRVGGDFEHNVTEGGFLCNNGTILELKAWSSIDHQPGS